MSATEDRESSEEQERAVDELLQAFQSACERCIGWPEHAVTMHRAILRNDLRARLLAAVSPARAPLMSGRIAEIRSRLMDWKDARSKVTGDEGSEYTEAELAMDAHAPSDIEWLLGRIGELSSPARAPRARPTIAELEQILEQGVETEVRPCPTCGAVGIGYPSPARAPERSDTERLDWLESHTKPHEYGGTLIGVTGDGLWEVGETIDAAFNGWNDGEGPTLRAAIDAARASHP